jgi:hypothetical protein
LRDQNELTIQLRGDAVAVAGVAPIMLGPARLIEPHHTRAYISRARCHGEDDVQRAGLGAFCGLLWLQAAREALRVGLHWRSGVGARRSRYHDGIGTPLRWYAWGAPLFAVRAR